MSNIGPVNGSTVKSALSNGTIATNSTKSTILQTADRFLSNPEAVKVGSSYWRRLGMFMSTHLAAKVPAFAVITGLSATGVAPAVAFAAGLATFWAAAPLTFKHIGSKFLKEVPKILP